MVCLNSLSRAEFPWKMFITQSENRRLRLFLQLIPHKLIDEHCSTKHTWIAHPLDYNDRPDLSPEDREILIDDLVSEITSIWQTYELTSCQQCFKEGLSS